MNHNFLASDMLTVVELSIRMQRMPCG